MSQFINPPLILGLVVAVLFYFGGWTTLIILAILVSVLLGLVYFNQNKLLYMPVVMDVPKSPSQNPLRMRHPKQHNLDTIDLKLKTQDGINICGWHIKHPDSKRIIIYFHENAGSKQTINVDIGTRIYFLRQLTRFTNSDVVLVAYRGYSDSQGEPSEQGIKKDAFATVTYAADYAKDHGKQLYLFGSSLGGAVAVHVASHPEFTEKINGLILQNTFTSISDMIDAVLPIFTKVKFLQTNHWRSIDTIRYIKAPILFIKSAHDQLVPPAHMHTLMNNANSSKLIEEYVIETGTHNSHWEQDRESYFSRMVKFFDKLKEE